MASIQLPCTPVGWKGPLPGQPFQISVRTGSTAWTHSIATSGAFAALFRLHRQVLGHEVAHAAHDAVLAQEGLCHLGHGDAEGDDGRLGRSGKCSILNLYATAQDVVSPPSARPGDGPRTRSGGANYAGCWIWTSENTPSTHYAE